jgi:hypothetical protein
VKPKTYVKPTPAVLLQLLSDYEVPYAIVSQPGAGFDAVLLGEPAPSPMRTRTKELSEVVDWIVAEELRRHAYSEFAVHYRSIAPSGHES